MNAIQVCGAIVDAEHDYARKDRTGTGYQEYAQKFMSSPGKKDGLYWPATAEEESPSARWSRLPAPKAMAPKGHTKSRHPTTAILPDHHAAR